MNDLVVSIIALSAAVIGFFSVIYGYVKSKRTEKEFAQKILSDAEITKIINEINSFIPNEPALQKEKKYNTLIEELKKAVSQLEENKRLEIISPLEQKSHSARIDYALKLVQMSSAFKAAVGAQKAFDKSKQKTA